MNKYRIDFKDRARPAQTIEADGFGIASGFVEFSRNARTVVWFNADSIHTITPITE